MRHFAAIGVRCGETDPVILFYARRGMFLVKWHRRRETKFFGRVVASMCRNGGAFRGRNQDVEAVAGAKAISLSHLAPHR